MSTRNRFARCAVLLTVVTSMLVGTSTLSFAGAFAPADSNGYVPEYYQTVGTCYDGVLGRDHYYLDRSVYYGPHVHWIEYDVCEMRRLGATSAGWDRLKAHERAHSRGLAHYEGSPATNPAYYPKLNVR